MRERKIKERKKGREKNKGERWRDEKKRILKGKGGLEMQK